LEDLAAKFKRPCILDLKIGTRQHSPDAPPHKVASKTAKCLSTTSHSLGLRMCGMQVYDAAHHRYIFRDKYYGRELTEETFPAMLMDFFNSGWGVRGELLLPFLEQLERFRKVMAQQSCFRFYSCSLLLIREGWVSEDQVQEWIRSGAIRPPTPTPPDTAEPPAPAPNPRADAPLLSSSSSSSSSSSASSASSSLAVPAPGPKETIIPSPSCSSAPSSPSFSAAVADSKQPAQPPQQRSQAEHEHEHDDLDAVIAEAEAARPSALNAMVSPSTLRLSASKPLLLPEDGFDEDSDADADIHPQAQQPVQPAEGTEDKQKSSSSSSSSNGASSNDLSATPRRRAAPRFVPGQVRPEPFEYDAYRIDVRLLDFAQTCPPEPGETGPDKGLLFGLDTLISLLKDLHRRCRTGEVATAPLFSSCYAKIGVPRD